MTAIVRKALLRISSGSNFGSGLLISPVDILTAKHVVSPSDVGSIRVTGQAFPGLRAPIHVSCHPHHDIAILHLADAAAANNGTAHQLPDSNSLLANVGDQLTAFGFSSIDRDLEERSVEFHSIDGIANVFACNPSVPAGFSGGPLMRKDSVVGVMIARNIDMLTTYAYPIGALFEFIQQYARGNVIYSPSSPHPLIRYPIGPMVPPDIVEAACFRVIDAYMALYAGIFAVEIVARANRDRDDAGPPTGQAGRIETHRLPDPSLSLAGFWHGAFREAGRKSPRMLAALLRLADEDSLNSEQRQDRSSFLKRLENWTSEHK